MKLRETRSRCFHNLTICFDLTSILLVFLVSLFSIMNTLKQKDKVETSVNSPSFSHKATHEMPLKETASKTLSSQEKDVFFANVLLKHHSQAPSELRHALMTNCLKIKAIANQDNQNKLAFKFVEAQKYTKVCQSFEALHHDSLSDEAFIKWLSNNFDVAKKPVAGKMTGYFQPELRASRIRQGAFQYPVYKRPSDLVLVEDLALFTNRASGIRLAGRIKTISNPEGDTTTLEPYFSRREIENGALSNQNLEIAYVDDPIDLFFMHIQGSGNLIFENGDRITVSYHGTNGHDYQAIGRVLVNLNALSLETVSMQSIKKWLYDHPNEAQNIMNQNQSYVFFREQNAQNDTLGAMNIPITSLVTVASDPHFHPLGSLLWIETDHKDIGSRFVLAQDVGGAIKGPGRLDIFCGHGHAAGQLAGTLNETISVFEFTPKS